MVERHEAIARPIARTDLEWRRLTNQLDGIDHQRGQLVRYISEAQCRIDQAERTLGRYDRPLRRHSHRIEIDLARRIVEGTPGDIERARNELRELQARRPAIEQELARVHAAARLRPDLDRERHDIRQTLEADIKTRNKRVTTETPAHLTAHLGPRPDHGPAATLWDETAARIDQHRSAFDICDTRNPLGPQPGWRDWNAYATSHRATTEACQRLHRALGRGVAIEPLQRCLSIGL